MRVLLREASRTTSAAGAGGETYLCCLKAAKTCGWGWGLPSTWEGWVVLAGYLALLALCLKVFPPHQNLPAFIISVHVLSGLLIAIYWWKGESPKWRWG